MVTVVENTSEYKDFYSKYAKSDRVLLIPLFDRLDYNPSETGLSLLYVRLIESDEQFLLCFSHSESFSLDLSLLQEICNLDEVEKYIYNKKQFQQYFDDCNGLIDVSLLYWFEQNNALEISRTPNIFFKFQRSAGKIKTSHIPIYQIADSCEDASEKIVEIIKRNGSVPHLGPFKRYNERVISIFSHIESNGLKIDKKVFRRVFADKIERKFGDLVYTNYNLFTSTGRPSNADSNINYAALDTDRGHKKPFISRFGSDGMLVLFDYDAFHLRLIGKLIDYDLPTESFHTYLGKKYFDKDQLTDQEYEESKKISFQLLYGDDIEEARNLEFFDRTYTLKEKIWSIYKEYGYIQTPLFHRQITGDHIKNMNPGKAFSYILQSYETEFNVEIIEQLIDLLKSHQSLVVLYTYDSILFDFNKNDGKELLYDIKNIMEGDRMLVKGYAGKSYDTLSKINLDL